MSMLGIYLVDIQGIFQQNICTRMVTEVLLAMVLKIHQNVRRYKDWLDKNGTSI